MSRPPVYTIGYGSRSQADFIQLLQAHAIEFLIDVRSQPYSRHKPDFSQAPLRQALADKGIRYVFMGHQLGGRPEDPECYREGILDYDLLEEMPFYKAGIGRVQDAVDRGFHVVLMCSEEKPEQCHRGKLIGRTLSVMSVDMRHIDENDQLITQEEMMLRQNNGQLTLFGTAAKPSTESPEAILKRVFGFDEFRPLQANIIENVLDKQDTLAIMPTGAGKSLCYQLPALIWPGLTVVVSPLISLMEDQVMQLRDMGVPATYLNSTLGRDGFAYTVAQIRQGEVRLLYAAPETLLRPDVLDLLNEIEVSCLTIDEAHCISSWGHDFRPEYRQLVKVRRLLPDAVCLALTATATERVRQDIKRSLAMLEATEYLASFDRENLFLEIAAKYDLVGQTLSFLDQHRDQSGIIYCNTRKQVDSLSAELTNRGHQVLPYHAGLDDAARRRHQYQFIRDDVPIMVATVAFGMGINKPDIRFVLHVDLPQNVESYYQQIGRAGRDGLRADCLLLYSYSDVQTINFLISQQAEQQQVGARTRLEAFLGFVESTTCRRGPLLAYFGETFGQESCDFCDNCLADDETGEDLTLAAQKFLSCVKRTGQLFGMTHIIDVLRGSRSQKVLQRGHDQLSTYNIGLEYAKKEWQQLARQFVQQGLLSQDMEYGSLRLTEQGEAVLGGEPFFGQPPAAPVATPVLAAYDMKLFELLRRRRKALADEQNVPPYIILSDRTLAEMATFYPHSREAFAALHGVGEQKLARYADLFLPLVVDYCAANNLQEKRKVAVKAAPSQRGNRRQEVVEHFRSGLNPDEIRTIYDVKLGTVIDHLWRALQEGETLPGRDLRQLSGLTDVQQAAVLQAFAEQGLEFLRPVYLTLNSQVPYEELHLLRLHCALVVSPAD